MSKPPKRGPRGPYKKRKVVKVLNEKSSNPFTIVNTVELMGSKTPHPFTNTLASIMSKLEVRNRKQSVFVSLTVCPDKKSAQNLILAARRTAESINPDYSFAVRYSFENNDTINGKYLGANIWRLN